MLNLPTVVTYLNLKSTVLALSPADPMSQSPFSPVPHCPTKHILIYQPWARSRVKPSIPKLETQHCVVDISNKSPQIQVTLIHAENVAVL